MPILQWLEKLIDCCFACLRRETPDKEAATKTCLIAHRGAHDDNLQIIENTHEAFERALALGCWGIEFDVHATADGILVVNHDPTLNRLWDKDLTIREIDFMTLRQTVPDIPSLAEIVERYGKRLHLFIELKAPFSAETMLYETLKTLTPCEDYHLLSLDEPLFASFQTFPNDVLLLVAVHNNLGQFVKTCLQKNYGGVLGHYLLVNSRKITTLKLANKVVGIGMVDSKNSLYREINRDLQWIFSNKVNLIKKCLNDLGKPQP